jgi:hypothetical protein
MNWVAIGGGMDAPSIYDLSKFLRATPDGAVLTVESSMRNVLPRNMMGIAMDLHVRCGIEDNLWSQSHKKRMSMVEQIVRMTREFGRKVATAQQAREISKIGVFYDTVEDTLAANGFAPNRPGATQGFLPRQSERSRPPTVDAGRTCLPGNVRPAFDFTTNSLLRSP